MKIKNISLVVVLNLFIYCTATSTKTSEASNLSTSTNTDIKINHTQSKSLIERFNKIRIGKKLNNVQADTILDNICAKIMHNNRLYKNYDNSFNEDSIRNLMFLSGITDYQYELVEFNDVDTLKKFSDFIVNDKFSNLRMGYVKNGNKHILFKTKNYLKFDHSVARCYSDVVDPMKNKSLKKIVVSNIKTDSVKYFTIPLINDDYYYEFSNKIPLRNTYFIKTFKQGGIFNSGKLVFCANSEQEAKMFLVVFNKNGLIVTIFK
ncbi:MAG TPA: hypothetical protein VK152_09430 [Paludibacter sp.]|nr:hypothetical protein [Paludibacter sp.]